MNDFDAPWSEHRDELYARVVRRGRTIQWQRRAVAGTVAAIVLAVPFAAHAAVAGPSSHVNIASPSTTTQPRRGVTATTRPTTTTTSTTAPQQNTGTPTTPPPAVTPRQTSPSTGAPSHPVTTVPNLPTQPSGAMFSATLSADSTSLHPGDTTAVHATIRNITNHDVYTRDEFRVAISCQWTVPAGPGHGSFPENQFEVASQHVLAAGASTSWVLSFTANSDMTDGVRCAVTIFDHQDAPTTSEAGAPLTMTVTP